MGFPKGRPHPSKGKPVSEKHLANIRAAQRRISLEGKRSGPNHWNWNPNRTEQLGKAKASKVFYGLVGRALEHLEKRKVGHGLELLGYTPSQLREHIESLFEPGMTWENHGKGPDKWHVDHIKPVSDFGPDATVAEVNALNNLRPLWEPENLSRGGRQGCRVRYQKT